MLGFLSGLTNALSMLGPQRAQRQPGPPRPPGSPPVTGPGGAPDEAASVLDHWAEGSTPPTDVQAPEAKKQDADTKKVEGQKQAESLPAAERDASKAQHDLEHKAMDPAAPPLSDAEQEKLAEKADPQRMRPEDVLKMRGISPTAIDAIRNSSETDQQTGVGLGDADMKDIWGKDGKKRPAAQADVDASHTNVRTGGAAMPAIGDQAASVVQAQSALSEDMKVGAEVRKAIPMEGVAAMIAGADGRNPAMAGDFGLKRNTEGQTSKEAVTSLGLDYTGSKYVQEGADGKYGFADSVKKEGVMMIDSTMTPDMLAKAQVPLGQDVFAAAQTQAAAAKAGGGPVSPLLQTDASGNMTHAFERNRTGVDDPRTGAGNSTVAHQELLAEAEADRPGQNVNVVNQEMKIGGAAGGATPLPAGKSEDGKSQSQMNLVQPDGSVVNICNLVPCTDKDGKPVMIDDGKGNMIPKTRWCLNIAPPDQGGMPPELKETWMERVFSADAANREAIAKQNAKIAADNADRKTRGEAELPFKPTPDAIPELAGYTPPDKKATP